MNVRWFERKKPSLGLDLIAEFSRRGRRGVYFDYAGYRRLRSVRTVAELRSLLDDFHYEVVPVSDDVKCVADDLETLQNERSNKITGLSFLASFDPFLLFFLWPAWLIAFGYMLLRNPDKAAARRIDAKVSKVE